MTAAASPQQHVAPWMAVRQFLAWWGSELSDIISTKASKSRAWRVMFLRSARGCDVYMRDRDRIELVGNSRTADDALLAELRQRLGRHRIAPTAVVLRLQPSEVVQARISVPAAASEVLEPILRNQIERLAPWPAEKALFAYQVAPASEGSTNLDVALAIAGSSLVDGLVTELSDAGFAPGVVDYGTDASAEPRLNLLAARSEERHKAGRPLLPAIGLVCVASLVAAAIGTVMLLQQTRTLEGLSDRLKEMRSKSTAALPGHATLRRQAWLVAQRGSQPSMAIVIEALSRALPDDAWLDRLEVEQGGVRLTGSAADAAALIGQIEASGHFTDVKFAAPTTMDDADKRESFTISGRIVPGRKLN